MQAKLMKSRYFVQNVLWVYKQSRSQWPRGLRCTSATARLLRLWVRIPPGALMFVCWVLWADHYSREVPPIGVCRCVWHWNLKNEEAMSHGGPQRKKKKKNTCGHDVTTKSINNCTPLHKSTVASTARRKTSTSFLNLRAGRQALAGRR
jgi:hypothetical protein